jgi:hypothetical protein
MGRPSGSGVLQIKAISISDVRLLASAQIHDMMVSEGESRAKPSRTRGDATPHLL